MGKVIATTSNPLPRREIAAALQEKILQRQGWRCAYCQADLHISGYHIDHKKPLCRGGTHHPNNLCAACKSCNERKGGRMSAREYREWLEECQNAPAGTWSCRNPGHAKYSGTSRWVPTTEFNQGDSWCRACRHRYMAARWRRVGAQINAMKRERYLLDGDYREQEKERSRESHQRNADKINQARQKRYHDPEDSSYRDKAVARAHRQVERRRAGAASIRYIPR